MSGFTSDVAGIRLSCLIEVRTLADAGHTDRPIDVLAGRS